MKILHVCLINLTLMLTLMGFVIVVVVVVFCDIQELGIL